MMLLCFICYNRYMRSYWEVVEPWSSACQAQIQAACNVSQAEDHKPSVAAAKMSTKIHTGFEEALKQFKI